MIWIDRAIGWFWSRVAASTVPALSGLGVLRVLCGLFFMLIIAPYSFWVGAAPPTLFKPPRLSVMALASGFPSTTVMTLADATSLVLVCCILLGIRARLATLLLVLVGILSSNAAMSFGKIDHDAMMWSFVFCMAFSGWGRSLALVPDKPSRLDHPQRAFALMALCLGFGMSVTGVKKAFGWVDFNLDTSGFLNWFVRGYFMDGRTDMYAKQVLSIPRVGFELIDYAGVVFEASCFVALLIGRRAWRFWIMAACLFHLINILTLNIPFLANLLIYLAFVDFGEVERTLMGWWSRASVRWAAGAIGVGMLLAHLVLRRAGIGRWLFFVLDEVEHSRFVMRFSAAVFVFTFFLVLNDQVQRWRTPSGSASTSAVP